MQTNDQAERKKALFLLVCTAILWSTSGLMIKLVTWNPLAIAGVRSAIASILIWAYVKKPKLNRSLLQWGAALTYALTVILFVVANKMTTSANAILLQYTAPVYCAIFAWIFLRERTTWIDWLTIIIVFSGMGLFFKEQLAPGAFWGNIIAILSGVSFALVAVLLRKQKDGLPVESVLLGNLMAAVVTIPFMTGPYPDFHGWCALLFMGLFQIGLSYILYALALKNVSAMDGILVPLIEPILNPVWVLIFTGEKPGKWALAGGSIVLIAVTAKSIISSLKQIRRRKPEIEKNIN